MRKGNKNQDIRKEIDSRGLNYWEVAEKIGIHPNTFSVWLRHELSDADKEKIRAAIKELTEDK